ncbi:ATP-binding protein [Ulvibacterium sp.]|uniref:ATP-binding protein n=1 Tax=Ulvibacterium sp. TaxID=2665914 RepID=UPI0026239C1F|nr:ATP-binding protein [Ulvibacterium sp.]
MIKTYFAVVFFFISLVSIGQESGMPFYRVYEPQEYRGHRQNWAAAQDKQGIMYFANEGLLSFNGEEWNLNMVPNQRALRSLATGHDRIYVGGNNELGFFKNRAGYFEFTSYLQHVPDSLKNFDRVWTTLVHKEHVYYQTDVFVLRISLDGEFKLWEFTDNNVWKLLLLDGTLYIDVPKEGLMALNDKDEFELVPNGEKLKFVGMEFLLPIDRGWIIEKRDTLRLFDGKELVEFKNEASEILQEYGVDNGLKTVSGDLIFTTRKKGGVVILDEEGKLKKHLTSDNGFSNEIVRNLFEDSSGSIWFALNTGISRLDLSAPLRYYDSDMGLNGTTTAVQRFNNKLYVGTTDGLKVLEQKGFEYVGSITSLIQDLDTIQNHLIVATSRDSLYAIDFRKRITTINHSKTKSRGIFLEILRPAEDDDSFICLYEEGLFQVRYEGDKWILKQELTGFFQDAEHLIQERPGKIWVDTGVNGFYAITYTLADSGIFDFENAKVKKYFLEEGIPNGRTTMFPMHGELIVTKDQEFFLRYNSEKDRFEKTANIWQFMDYERKNDSITDFWKDGRKSDTWMEIEKNGRPFLLNSKKEENKYEHYSYPLNTYTTRFGDIRGARTFQVEKGKVYYGGIKGLVEYNIENADEIAQTVNVHITKMSTSDTTYFNPPVSGRLENIGYNNRALVFEFSSTSYKDTENKRYQYLLEGFDTDWSEPSRSHTKEYTSLPPGDYTFKVKALNDYFIQSPVASIGFTVNRPWYWNMVSIATYMLLIGVMTYLFSQWRTKNLKRKNLRLQETINNAVAETQRQADEIAELYEVKNRFFANISHELRTPLTLILGPSSDLMEDDSLRPLQKNKLAFINNNAKRLLRLINQLLDLSKLEAGKLDLKVSQQNIIKTVSMLTESFDSMAVSRKIKLEFSSDLKELHVFYDMDKMEQVLINLLSNAMKFTKEGGKVQVSVEKQEGKCLIEVKDSGIGINEEQLPYIFDRFYQADNSESREHEGTGIGLSLTKELVEAHGGKIYVESKTGQGTIFQIVLLLGKAHFEEYQLTKLTPVPPESKTNIAKTLLVEEVLDGESRDFEEVVLVVEDNSEMRAYIKGQMQKHYKILEAENGQIGFEIAQSKVPDLIISDVMMPKMDGTQLCQKIKNTEVTSHIPVILLTAKASEEDKIKGLSIEADAYLAKPFNKEELNVRVKNLILNRKKLQKRFAQSTLISPKEIAVTSMEEAFLEKLVNQIEENLGDETFGVEQLANAINLSRSQLHRKMLSILDQTPSLFIRKYRLERAKQLLKKHSGRVSDIAFQVGFSSPSYFTKCFVEEFGYPPKDIHKNKA